MKSKINRDYEDFSPNILKDETSRYIDQTVMVEQDLQARDIRVRSPSRGSTIKI